METDYIYGVARIRALEGTLFSDDMMNALLHCSDYEQCLSFLKDKGWGNGSPEQSFEEMIFLEKNKTKHLISELAGNNEEIDILTIGDEFHNLKAAIKQVCTNNEKEDIFYEGCKLKPEFLKNCIRQGKYFALPEEMREAAKEATEMLIQTGSGQLCDVIIDRANLYAIKEKAEKSQIQLIKKYADTLITIADIKIAVRCVATNKDSEFVKKCVVPCSGISVTDLTASVDGGIDSVCSYLENAGFGEAVRALKQSMSVFECWCDNKIIEDIKPEKYNSFTIGPIVAYAIAKDIEIKTVKIILSCKQNGFDNDFIKERIRVMYA
jgi:V/A-type H+-transporting ATPase subunit C